MAPSVSCQTLERAKKLLLISSLFKIGKLILRLRCSAGIDEFEKPFFALDLLFGGEAYYTAHLKPACDAQEHGIIKIMGYLYPIEMQ